MENSSIRRQWLDSYQSHLLEEEHSPQTIRKYIHDIAFFFSFLPAEAEISKEKVLAYKQEPVSYTHLVHYTATSQPQVNKKGGVRIESASAR